MCQPRDSKSRCHGSLPPIYYPWSTCTALTFREVRSLAKDVAQDGDDSHDGKERPDLNLVGLHEAGDSATTATAIIVVALLWGVEKRGGLR